MWGWGRREVRSAPSQPSTHGTHNASAALLLVCSARREADLVTKYEIPEMVKRGKGAIVNNGSVTGLIGAPGAVANVSSKHGVRPHQIGCFAIRYAGNPSQRSGPRECAHSNIRAIHRGPSGC